MWRALLPGLAFALLVASCGPRPEKLTGEGVTPGVWGRLFVPRTPGAHPAVLLVPGSYGWRSDYARVAASLADSGFVALAIDYYAETGRGSTPAQERANWPTWQQAVRNAVAYLDTLPAVGGRRIGLVGYSRGAFLVVSVAGALPRVGAVVDYYGGGSDDDLADTNGNHFPPLLILHGTADTEISVALAHRLYDRIHERGGDVEMHLYPGAQHVFNRPGAPTYSATYAADAWERTVAFLRNRLGD